MSFLRSMINSGFEFQNVSALMQNEGDPSEPMQNEHEGTTDDSLVSINSLEGVVEFQPGILLSSLLHSSESNGDEGDSNDDDDGGSFGGVTILSSDPSADTFGVPTYPHNEEYRSDDRMVFSSAMSISTTESCVYPEISPTPSVASSLLSMQPSMLESSFLTATSTSETGSAVNVRLGPSVLSADASLLDRRVDNEVHSPATRSEACNAIVPLDANEKHWFSNFSEEDWESFRARAQILLGALEPRKLPRVPPVLSDDQSQLCTFNQECLIRNLTSNVLPGCFTCPLCSGPIVGAVTLDCCCPRNSVCGACWELHELLSNVEEGARIETDYVWVSSPRQKNPKCPSCSQDVLRTPTPSHALDMAILQLVQNLPSSGLPLAVKTNYFERSMMWRNEIIRRRQDLLQDQDAVLACLIQQEENHAWDSSQTKKARFRQKVSLVSGRIAAAIAVSIIAAFGLRLK